MHTHLEELVGLPHPSGQALERDVDRRDRVAAEQFRLVALQYRKRDAEQDVESVQKQDVPHTEQRLRHTYIYI